jgi:hypothetical protein
MKQIISVAPARVAWTNPDRISDIRVWVGMQRHVKITGQTHLLRQLELPARVRVRGRRIRRTLRRQKVAVIRRVKMRRQPPLLEAVEALGRLCRRLGLAQRGQQQQFNQRECLRPSHALFQLN